MKKCLFLLFAILVLSGCLGKDDPAVTLNASKLEGVPGDVITFDASESEVGGGDALKYCKYVVEDPSGNIIAAETSSLGVEDGELTFAKYSFSFVDVGTYIVSAEISDAAKRTGVASVEIIINSQLVSQVFSLDFAQVYTDRPFNFIAVGLDPANIASYKWTVFNSSGEQVYSSSLKNPEIISGFSLADEYSVQLTLFDAYDNSVVLVTSFEVISPEQPTAFITSEVPFEVVEYQQFTLNASTSTADNIIDSQGSIVKCDWYLYRDAGSGFNYEVDHISRTSTAPFVYEVPSADDYQLVLIVENQNGLKDETETVDIINLKVMPNRPIIQFYDISPTPFYEGRDATISVLPLNNGSLALNRGEIVKLVMDFDESFNNIGVNDIIIDIAEDDPLMLSWRAPYNDDDTALISYTGNFYLVNDGGTFSEPKGFVKQVRNLTPKAVISVDRQTLFHGDSIKINATTSNSPSGSVLASVLVTLTNVTDSIVTTIVDQDGSASVIDFTFPSDTGIKVYDATCTVVDVDGHSSISVISITVKELAILADFSMDSDPDMEDVFIGETINLDASSSKKGDGSGEIPSTLLWSLEKSGVSGDIASSLMNSTSSSEPLMVFETPGSYELTLTVTDALGSDIFTRVFAIKNALPDNIIITTDEVGDGIYDFSVSAYSPDGSVMSYTWYVDDHPANPSATVTGTGPSLAGQIFLSDEHVIYVVVENSAGGAIKDETFIATDRLAPLAVALSSVDTSFDAGNGCETTADSTPSWNWSDTDGETPSKYRYYLDVNNDGVTVPTLNGSEWIETADGTISTFVVVAGSDLVEGFHTLYVQSCDDSPQNNWPDATDLSSTYTASVEIFVDLTAPSQPVITSSTPTNSGSPTWDWPDVATAANYKWNLDGGAWTAVVASEYTPVVDLISSGEADFELNVVAVDAYGNESNTGSFKVSIDKVGPAAPVATTANTKINDLTPIWTFSGPSGDFAAYRVRVVDTGEDWTVIDIDDLSATPFVTLSGSDYVYERPSQLSSVDPDGDIHTFEVQAQDSAGNWGSTGSSPLVIDNTAIDDNDIVVVGPVYTPNLRPTWTFNGPLGIIEYQYQFLSRTGGTDPVPNYVVGSTYIPVSDLEIDNYRILVKVLDDAGNLSDPKDVDIEIYLDDSDAPVIAWVSEIKDAITIVNGSGDYSFSLHDVTAFDNTDGDITGTAQISCEITFPPATTFVDDDTDGTYEITYTAVDTSANSSWRSRTVTVVTLNPPTMDSAIINLSALDPYNNDFTVSGVTSDPIVEQSLRGDIIYTWSTSGPFTYIDPTPNVTAETESMDLRVSGEDVSIIVRAAYELYPSIYSEKSWLLPVSHFVENHDFEDDSVSIAPWYTYWFFEWNNTTWPASWDNTEYLGREDMPFSYTGSDIVKFATVGGDTVLNLTSHHVAADDAGVDIGWNGALLKSNVINLKAGQRYRLTVDCLNQSAAGSSKPDADAFFGVVNESGFTANNVTLSPNYREGYTPAPNGSSAIFQQVAYDMTTSEDYWVEFTAVSDSTITVRLNKNERNYNAMTYGLVQFDDVRLSMEN